MKLKYYLRGMGIGIILTAIVMGFALGGRKTTISDAEVIERAKALGMIDGNGVLDSVTDSSEVSLDDSLTPGSTLASEGAEVSQKNDQEFSSSGEYVSDMASETEEREDSQAEITTVQNEDAGTESTKEKNEASSGKSGINKAEEDQAAVNKSADETAVAEEIAAENKSSATADSSVQEAPKPSESQAIGNKTTVTKNVTIPSGIGSEGVARVLYNAGVVDDAVTFNNYLVERKMDRSIRAGQKVFPAGSSYEDIARIICQG